MLFDHVSNSVQGAEATGSPRSGLVERGTLVRLPVDVEASALPSMVEAIGRAFRLLSDSKLLERADALAEIAVGVSKPSMELLEERIQRARTIREVFEGTEWLTADVLNGLQMTPPKSKAYPAADWKRRGRIFGVSYGGRDYFARYQFDAMYEPLPVIKEVLDAYGEVADPWALAAWFHFPNGRLVERVEGAAGDDLQWRNLAPKDCLDRRSDVVMAAAKRRASYNA